MNEFTIRVVHSLDPPLFELIQDLEDDSLSAADQAALSEVFNLTQALLRQALAISTVPPGSPSQSQPSITIQRSNTTMATVQDFVAAQGPVLASLGTALTALDTGIKALDAMITAFQNSPGTLSAADQAALDGIQATSKALVAQANAISTAPPGVALPPPPPLPPPPAG